MKDWVIVIDENKRLAISYTFMYTLLEITIELDVGSYGGPNPAPLPTSAGWSGSTSASRAQSGYLGRHSKRFDIAKHHVKFSFKNNNLFP